MLLLLMFMICSCAQNKEMPKENPIVTMDIKDFGQIKIELYPNIAFNTVANFVNLIEEGFYDNNTIHRVQKGFVIQGGDPTGTGTGGPGYSIKGEFSQNGFNNTLSHTKGVISMARKDYSTYSSINPALTTYGYNSAGSQFFIMTEESNSLDGYYAAFGEVTEGMDIVEKIANVEVYYRSSELKDGESAPKDSEGKEIASDKPKKAPVIKSVTVETYGVDYGIPETVEEFDMNSWYTNFLMQKYGYSQQ